MFKKYFIRLFTYNNWANHEIVAAMKRAGAYDEEAYKIFSHLINAQYIWVSRIKNNPSVAIPVWKEHTLEEFENLIVRNFELWLDYLNNDLTDSELARVFHYSNSYGEQFTNTIADVLPHVVNHASYHRGQIVKRLKAIGLQQLPSVDFIVYTRSVENKL